MDNQTIQLIAAGGIFLSTFLAALLPLKIIGTSKSSSYGRPFGSYRVLSICNCLAGGVFLTTCFLGLIPSAQRKFDHIYEKLSVQNNYPITEAVVLAGFYMILIFERIMSAVQEFGCKKDNSYLFEMDQLSQQRRGRHDSSDSEDEIDLFEMQPTKPMLHRENGKVGPLLKKKNSKNWDSGHGHSHLQDINGRNLGRALIVLMALSIHSVFEGMALGVEKDQKNAIYLIIAILAHETLAAFALGANMVKNGVSGKVFVFYATVFSLTIPVGISIGLVINVNESNSAKIAAAVTQALAAGVFIFVTFFEIFGHEFENQQDWLLKVAASLVGFLLLAGLEVLFMMY